MNTAFSLYYYLRVLKTIFIDPPPADRLPVNAPSLAGWYVALIALPLVVLGMSPLQDDLSRTAQFVASSLFK
jgi:NADH:ubiquinone oxidoreductase subunit 2 (subunit N)